MEAGETLRRNGRELRILLRVIVGGGELWRLTSRGGKLQQLLSRGWKLFRLDGGCGLWRLIPSGGLAELGVQLRSCLSCQLDTGSIRCGLPFVDVTRQEQRSKRGKTAFVASSALFNLKTSKKLR